MKKIQFYVSEEHDLKIIDELQRASGARSRAAVVKDALGLYDWARKQRSNGFAIVAYRDGLPMREVILPFK